MRAAAFIGLVLTAIGIVLTVYFELSDEPPPTAPAEQSRLVPFGPETQIGTQRVTKQYFIDGKRFSDARIRKPVGGFYCAEPSLTSDRPDSLFCVLHANKQGTGLVVDPCFPVDSMSVACTYKDELRRFRLSGSALPPPSLTDLPDSDKVWPWAVELRSGVKCSWRYFVRGSPVRVPNGDGAPEYVCGEDRPIPPVTSMERMPNGDARISRLWVFDPRPKEPKSLLVEVEKSQTGPWTAMYSPRGSDTFRRVFLAAVWF